MTDEEIDVLLDELAHACTLCRGSGFNHHISEVVELSEKTIKAVSDRLKLLDLPRNRM